MAGFGEIVWERKINTDEERDPSFYDTTPNEVRKSDQGRTFVNDDTIAGTVIGDRTGPYPTVKAWPVALLGIAIVFLFFVNPYVD